MQPFSFSFFGYSLGEGGWVSGRVRALNLTVPLGSGRVGSDNLGYGPGSGFSFEPVQTSTVLCCFYGSQENHSSVIALTAGLSMLLCVNHILNSTWFHTTTIVFGTFITSSPCRLQCNNSKLHESKMSSNRINYAKQHSAKDLVLLLFLKSNCFNKKQPEHVSPC